MSAELIWEVFEAAVDVTKEFVINGSLGHNETKQLLRDFVDKTLDVYEVHTGEPLFPDLIKPEDSV